MSEPERTSEETQTELIPQEAPPRTLEISEAVRTGSVPPATGEPPAATAPVEASPAATAPVEASPAAAPAPEPAAPPAPPAAAPPAAPRPAPLPPPMTPAPPLTSPAGAYPEPTTPPTAAFVPPELLARRRAAAPPSTPYQPIAGWSTAPAPAPPTGPVNPAGPGGPATQGNPLGPVQGATTAGPALGPPTGRGIPTAQPAGPANGFAGTPVGAPGQAGPASAPGLQGPGGPATGAIRTSPPGRRSGPSLPLMAVLAVLVIAAAVIGGLLWQNGQKNTPPPTTAASPTATKAPAALTFQVSTYTTTQTGFRAKKGSTWDTPTFSNSKFGNLKPGAGLVLDLGSPQTLSSVNFNAQTGPLTVELRAADQKPVDGTPLSQSGGKPVGGSVQASGPTPLDASKGGKHQYWMIWVTDLGPTFKAVISDISVKAS